jgi:hypothetical protein
VPVQRQQPPNDWQLFRLRSTAEDGVGTSQARVTNQGDTNTFAPD